jgi:MGT family glycosyltransferase
VAKIAVVNVPFFSHIGAAIRLCGVLSRQGHSLVVWGPSRWQAQIEATGVRFELHEPPMPRVVGFMNFAATLAATTEELAEPLIEDLFAHELDLVVHDSQVPWARVAAEFLGLPRVVSHPMFPIIADHRIRSVEEQEPVPIDPEAAKAKFEASWLAIARRWGVEFAAWGSVIHTSADSDATIAFTTREIVGEARPGWHFVGPLMDAIARSDAPQERPLVYACFGTSFNARTEQFRAVIDGLAHEPIDVLVSTGAGRVSSEALAPLPPNVVVREFVDAREVLGRASVHITHCGNNSVHETLLAGVPMLCMPQAYDQFPLAGRVVALGAGRIAEEDPEAVRAGVRWLLEDDAPRARAQELGQHLASYDGEGRVAEVFEQVLSGTAALSA